VGYGISCIPAVLSLRVDSSWEKGTSKWLTERQVKCWVWWDVDCSRSYQMNWRLCPNVDHQLHVDLTIMRHDIFNSTVYNSFLCRQVQTDMPVAAHLQGLQQPSAWPLDASSPHTTFSFVKTVTRNQLFTAIFILYTVSGKKRCH